VNGESPSSKEMLSDFSGKFDLYVAINVIFLILEERADFSG
jgi:hypothetical protein